MKEIKRRNQHRRDFRADYECQACNAIEKNISGYDDTYFNVKIVNEMKCKECGESNNSLTIEPTDSTTTPAHIVM